MTMTPTAANAATTPFEAPLHTPEERKKRIFAIVGASSGNLVEWFDFYIYFFVPFISRLLFSRPVTPLPSC